MSKKRDRCPSYTFRPFDLTKVVYKCYDGIFDRGINAYPKPRSGHRIACNDSEIFLFGGFNPATARSANSMLFQEMWRFDKFTKKWKLWFGPRDECEQLPTELASNAMAMENDMLVVRLINNIWIPCFFNQHSICGYFNRYTAELDIPLE